VNFFCLIQDLYIQGHFRFFILQLLVKPINPPKDPLIPHKEYS
jgi:hypothetical protein